MTIEEVNEIKAEAIQEVIDKGDIVVRYSEQVQDSTLTKSEIKRYFVIEESQYKLEIKAAEKRGYARGAKAVYKIIRQCLEWGWNIVDAYENVQKYIILKITKLGEDK